MVRSRFSDVDYYPISGYGCHFVHSNLQESQLAKVDSDAKEDAGRNDDHGPISYL